MEKRMEHNYKILFKIGDGSFEIETTDLKWLEKKENEYFKKLSGKSVKRAIEEQQEEVESGKPGVLPKMALNEFYRMYVKKIKSRPTIAVYFVYYLQKLQKKDKVKTADVTKCFKDISYPNWNKLNMTDVLASAKRRALVNYVNKLWSLTTTGEDYVFNAMTGKKK